MEKLKEILFYVVVCIFFFIVIVFATNKLDEYNLNCKVYEVDTCDKVVTFETPDGHLYETFVLDIEDFEVGDTWKVTFKDWEDADPKNDTIQKIKNKVE